MTDSTEPGTAVANIGVHPAYRNRGVGTRPLATAEEHLHAIGAATVGLWTEGDGSSCAFAERHGYRRGRSAQWLRLDLAAAGLPPVPAVPDGLRLVTGEQFADDPRPMYEADVETGLDEPRDEGVGATPYADWLAMHWEHPALDLAFTTAAMAGGTVVAFTAAYTDGQGRYLTAMTGTRRPYRGRGLAKLVKTHSLHRARATGHVEAYTGNDAGNGPMLAVNRWLGYRHNATRYRYLRAL